MENLSYIAATGRYYLRVYPWVAPPATTTYSFMVSTTATYDAGEANDNVWQAKPYTNSININRTIDNVYDEDWYSLTVNKAARLHTISLSNVPSGGQYVVAIYDTNFNVLDTFISTSSASVNYNIDLDTYYLRIFSLNGVYSTSQNYTLAVTPNYTIADGVQFTANGGQAIEVATYGVYIDGTKINLDWDYSFYPPGEPGKYQWLNTYSNTKVGANAIARGTLTGGSFFGGNSYDVSTSNCIRVLVTNISYKNHFGVYQLLEAGGAAYIYIDVTNKKVVDSQTNSYNNTPPIDGYCSTFTIAQTITP
jgi:hypothetical protein